MTLQRLAMLLATVLPLTAQEHPPSSAGIRFYSLEKEAALGQKLAEQANRRSPPLDSPTVQSYVRSLGEKIAAYVPDATFSFNFSVTADDECRIAHEPIALPGGYIFVPAGLFLAAQDEAEFAGMLAHAMQHVGQRHGIRQETPATGVSIPLIFIGGSAGNCLGAAVTPMALLKSQRSAELQADVLAVQTMARAGFDPNALVRYVNRVQPSLTPAFRPNSAMPDREARVATMLSIIEKMPLIEFTTAPTAEFAGAKEEVRRLIEQRAPSPAPPSLLRKKPE